MTDETARSERVSDALEQAAEFWTVPALSPYTSFFGETVDTTETIAERLNVVVSERYEKPLKEYAGLAQKDLAVMRIAATDLVSKIDSLRCALSAPHDPSLGREALVNLTSAARAAYRASVLTGGILEQLGNYVTVGGYWVDSASRGVLDLAALIVLLVRVIVADLPTKPSRDNRAMRRIELFTVNAKQAETQWSAICQILCSCSPCDPDSFEAPMVLSFIAREHEQATAILSQFEHFQAGDAAVGGKSINDKRTPVSIKSDHENDPTQKIRKKMTKEATACATLYRQALATGDRIPMKNVVSDYCKMHGGKASYIIRVLNDNPEQWKQKRYKKR